MNKSLLKLLAIVGMTIGAIIPTLFLHDGDFGFGSIVGGFIGGIIGIWLAVKLGKRY